jgi:phenylpropionate dioxygenase-like ring-hydroxylating dioxygenase large terminal subunit
LRINREHLVLVSQQAVFRRYWHAAMPLSHLANGPRPFRLMGQDIVLFLDENGQPAALRDRCCHRTAKLSLGWCVDAKGQPCTQGRIQCAYHGWTYDRAGHVVFIPQYGVNRAVPPDYRTQAFACQARYGYAWVCLEEPVQDIPAMPEFDAPGWRTIFQFHEVWRTSPVRALENSFDNAHFSFVHRNTFGLAAQPVPSRYELTETEFGFLAETVVEAANPPGFERICGSTAAVTQRHMRNAWLKPFCRRLDIEYPSGIRHVILNAFTPMDDEHIQVCQWLFRNDTEADCPAQLLIDFDRRITLEDKAILESTDPDAVVDLRRRGVEFSMESDRPGILIRKQLMALLLASKETEIHR